MKTPKTDDGALLSPPPCSRFRLEERSGIVAIYDTQHPEYVDTPGCHADYPWVVCSWKGRYVTPPDPECLNGCGHWTVEKRWVEKAYRTLELLNSLCANSPTCVETDGGESPPACSDYLREAMDYIIDQIGWADKFPRQCHDRIRKVCEAVKRAEPLPFKPNNRIQA